ncbi:hypothetical protein HZB97_00725 [Candidatus Gottesmanbacteria bacterium]|nr:hypothetical protein [Candidatus Gottesmanbacteria bacterium]
MKISNFKFQIGAAIILISPGVLFRTLWHIAPNVEFVTAASLLAAAYLGRKYAVLVPFVIMVITDTLIGNTNIFIFTWSAFLIIGLAGLVLRRLKGIKLVGGATAMGATSALFFYLYTNFGVWLLDSWGMYSRDLSGLLNAYIMGLPFLKLNLLGNLFFVPVSFGIVEGYRAAVKIFQEAAISLFSPRTSRVK